MVTIATPKARVFQEFRQTPTEVTNPLRSHVSGGNAMLHRFDVAAEKALIGVGAYDKDAEATYPWPERVAGSLVDEDSVKLFIENALLLYFTDLIGDASGGRGTVTVVSGKRNYVRSSTVNFRTNGAYSRAALLLDRDVAIGDRVYIRGVFDPDGACEEIEHYTYVSGFAADQLDGTVSPAFSDDNNQATVEAATSIEKIGGPDNCVTAVANGAGYDGLASGYVEETYTIEVVKSSISGCNAARLRVTSASGTDDQDEFEPEAFGDPTEIGTRGLLVTFDTTTGDCEDSASSAGVAEAEFVVGQKWEVTVRMAFEKTCPLESGEYTGSFDDTYIVEVTKGGVWADLPEISVTTAKGLDKSGPTIVSGDNVAVPIGTNGLSIQFGDCFGSSSSLVGSESVELGDFNIDGLRKGDKFYVTVVSGQNGPVRTLILRDDVPVKLLDATDLDLRLFIEKTIEVTRKRLSDPPNLNYEIETTQMVVNPGITAYDASWTDGGVEQPLSVWDGRAATATDPSSFGQLYIEYREWLVALTTGVNFINDVANLDVIPGPLDELNPLKYGVYYALLNSNGTNVGYTAVADPSSIDSWQNVLDLVDGRDDVYKFVPMTRDVAVWNLFKAHVLSESDPEQSNWKSMVVNLQIRPERMVVGQSDADDQALQPTSVDGEVVLATLADDPDATGTQYTRLSVPANNSGFLTYGVRAGDVVRYLYSIDSFGDETYTEFVVDSVLSQNTLLLQSGHSAPISVAQKIEIWRTLTKAEIVADLQQQAAAMGHRRVVCTLPDIAGLGGNALDGTYFGAAIAGLCSGIAPHRSATNVTISGFDDLSSRTNEFFSDTQLGELANAGIWLGIEDKIGTPITRHALTSDPTDLNSREEMIVRNVDSISYLFLARLRPLIGRANATPSVLKKIRYEVQQTIKFLKRNGFTDELGAQLIDGGIAVADDGTEQLYIHPLAADRVVVVINLQVPAPLNNLDIHLVI